MIRTQLPFFVWIYAFLAIAASAADNGNSSVPRFIKGQQLIRQTATARLVGGPIPPELLLWLQKNISEVSDSPEPLVDPKLVPKLITDEVKTTITRMVIPLSTSLTNSERYNELLQKFLNRNHVNLSQVDPLEGTGDVLPSFSVIGQKMLSAARLRSNLVAALAYILYLPGNPLPPGHHAPIAHILHLLQLKRIPVFDLLKNIGKLSKSTPQEQWLIILDELGNHIPPYMKSCITFLLESLQERTLDLDKRLLSPKGTPVVNLLAGIPLSGISFLHIQKNLLFPKRIISQISHHSEEALGRTLAAILVAAAENSRNLNPRLFALFLLHLPRDNPSPIFDEIATSLTESEKPTNAEMTAVIQASGKILSLLDEAPNEIFQKVLLATVQVRFPGVEVYETLLGYFPIATEMYAIQGFQTMAPLMNSKTDLTTELLDRAVDDLAPKIVTLAKEELIGLIEQQELVSKPSINKFSSTSPAQLLQLALFSLPTNENIKMLELYLNIKTRLGDRGRLNLLELAVYGLVFEERSSKEVRNLGVQLVGRCPLLGELQMGKNCQNSQQCVADILQRTLQFELLPNPKCVEVARKLLLSIGA